VRVPRVRCNGHGCHEWVLHSWRNVQKGGAMGEPALAAHGTVPLAPCPPALVIA
jgi:hypothetical protein